MSIYQSLLALVFLTGNLLLTQVKPNYVPGEIIVKFKQGVLDINKFEDEKHTFYLKDIYINKNKLDNTALDGNLHVRKIVRKLKPSFKSSISRSNDKIDIPDFWNILVISFPKTINLLKKCEEIKELDFVEWAEPNFIYKMDSDPNDTYFNLQKSFNSTSSYNINIQNAWNYSKGNNSVKIGILDTGIDYNNVDLGSGSYGTSSSKVSGGNDYINNDNNPIDDQGHGTKVAGIIGGLSNNSTGIAGIAGGDGNNIGCQLIALKVANQFGNYSVENVFEAIVDASTSNPNYGLGCHILNMSGGGSGNSYTYSVAIKYAAKNDVVFVAAKGNDGVDWGHYPADIADEEWVIAVGAADPDGKRVWNLPSISGPNWASNYGGKIDVIAPGYHTQIYTTHPGGLNYGTFQGTSAATPHVSGIAALLKSYRYDLDAVDIQNILKYSAIDVINDNQYNSQIYPGYDIYTGWGRVDAGKAFELLQNPYELSHYTINNGSIFNISDWMTIWIDDQTIVPAADSYIVKRYKVRKTINFQNYYDKSYIWGRIIGSQGWKNSLTQLGVNQTTIISSTTNSVTLESCVYWIQSNDNGGNIKKWAPCRPEEVIFSYTHLHTAPLFSPTISSITQSPSPLYRGQSGTITCNASGDNLTYSWTIQSQPDFITLGNLNGSTLEVSNIPMLANKSGNENLYLKPPQDLIVTCTVSNPAGSVSRSFTANVIPSDPPGGGCPFLFVQSDNGYVMDNNLLHRSEFEGNTGKDIKDVYKLKVNPVADKNKLKFQIKELNHDHSYFDRIKLYSVDHPSGTEIGVTENNDIVLYLPSGVVSTSNAILNDKNVTDLIQYNLKSPGVEGVSNERIFMNFDRKKLNSGKLLQTYNTDGSADSVAVIMNIEGISPEPVDPPKEMAGTIDGSESAENIFKRGFARREKQSVVIVPLGNYTSLDSLNIEWHRDYDMQYAAVTPVLYGGYEKKELNLIEAVHSIHGNIKQLLNKIDQSYAELDTNGFITLTFNEGGKIKSGWTRSYIIETDGYYVLPGAGENKGLASNSIQKEQLTGSALPTKYELGANYPNPFNPTTTIEYAVPNEGQVTVKVYDILGREVVTLVNEYQSPGRYKVTWNAAGMPSGLYIYRMTAKDFKSVRKMLLIK